MTMHADFLARIIKDRDDDGPRLIYADWLDEKGEEARAEFIRRSLSEPGEWFGRSSSFAWCEAPAPGTLTPLRLDEGRPEKAILESLPTVVSDAFIHRGFVAEIACTSETWLGEWCKECGGSKGY